MTQIVTHIVVSVTIEARRKSQSSTRRNFEIAKALKLIALTSEESGRHNGFRRSRIEAVKRARYGL